MPSLPPKHWIAAQFECLETRLVNYATRLLAGDKERARDVVQEAFIRLCNQSWPDIEPHVRPWLYRTCRNRAIDLLRRESRMHSIEHESNVVDSATDSSPEPGSALSKEEQCNALQRCILKLGDKQQEVLRLRLQENLSYKQIAEVTGLTVSNVGYLLHQAIVKLRSQLASEA